MRLRIRLPLSPSLSKASSHSGKALSTCWDRPGGYLLPSPRDLSPRKIPIHPGDTPSSLKIPLHPRRYPFTWLGQVQGIPLTSPHEILKSSQNLPYPLTRLGPHPPIGTFGMRWYRRDTNSSRERYPLIRLWQAREDT